MNEPDLNGLQGCPDRDSSENARISRRSLLKTAGPAGALAVSGCVSLGRTPNPASSWKQSVPREETISVHPYAPLDKALRMCAQVYPANRRRDMLSFTNKTGRRMTVSPNGFPVAICMCPDLTFGLLGSRFLANRDYLDTFRGHLDALPRNMRLNGKFFINEDMLAGADRVMTQVMYPLWIWELYRATADHEIIESHRAPLLRCLNYIESRTDDRGIVRQVDPDDWQLSEGADWVDWCAERMEGSTCVYHTWYVRALEGCVRIFRALDDAQTAGLCQDRLKRQRAALDDHFWNGTAYWDNLDFQGERVGRFWCDSQLWPIAFGYASPQQAAPVFSRIDADPEVFEGVPTRWCAPVSDDDKDDRYEPGGKYAGTAWQGHREFSWFGRLGAGDIAARCASGQNEHAFRLACRYAEVVTRLGTIPECLDMRGNMRRGTGGAGDYLEHAGGFLWCVGAALFGIGDFQHGSLVWTPALPDRVLEASAPLWHKGTCWRFGIDPESYWVDPGDATGEIRLVTQEGSAKILANAKRVTVPRRPVS